jgi:hypothetical protein
LLSRIAEPLIRAVRSRRLVMRSHKKGRSVRPQHAEELDSGVAFIDDFRHGFHPAADGDVEAFGEEFVAGATSNDSIGELARDETYAEEVGGFAFELFDEEVFDLL